MLRQRISAAKGVSKKEIPKSDLANLYSQETNRRMLWLPISPLVSLYYTGEKRFDPDKFQHKKEKIQARFDKKLAKVDSTNIRKITNLQFRLREKLEKQDYKIENGNLLMQWGEPVAIYDSTKVEETKSRFQIYLFSKGYFKNTVTSKTNTVLKTNSVTYTIDPGPVYKIDTIFYQIADTGVFKILNKYQAKSTLQIGEVYDEEKISKERDRIDLLLKDNGYFDFSRQYVEFRVDTAYTPGAVALMLVVNDPEKRAYHKKFKIDEVHFVTDAGKKFEGVSRTREELHNVEYSYYTEKYRLQVLSHRVFLAPGQYYSREKTFDTQRQIANLEAFKFVNINYDTSGGKFIANIYTSALDQYQWTNEFGVNVTQGYPGPFFNTTFRKRNLFRGLETLDISARFGYEGVASLTENANVYQSTEAGVNVSLTWPQLLIPSKQDLKYRLGKYNPKTKMLMGFTYSDRPEYRRRITTVSGTYTWQNKRTHQYSLTLLNLNIIDTLYLSNEFKEELIDQGENGNFSLVNSFKPSFVTSVIFGITWNKNYFGTFDQNSSWVRVQVEPGGSIWNVIDPTFIQNAGLEYYKYIRLSLDIRKNKVVSKTTTLAFHFNSGVGYGYAENKSLPYEKLFFAGGSNSVRAWRPRRLGPGSFKPTLDDNPQGNGLFDYSIEKPADILLEGSIELRQKMVGFLSGAVFLDVGNVWTFNKLVKKDDQDNVIENGNSQFRLDSFLPEMGVGTGFGLRFNFSFLVLRFDVGLKVYDPARDEGDRFMLNRVKFFKPFGTNREPVIYNIGIGYPF